MFSTYQRLGLHVSASNITVIRKARQVLRKATRSDPVMRPHRAAFYREMLDHHANARSLYRAVVRGDF